MKECMVACFLTHSVCLIDWQALALKIPQSWQHMFGCNYDQSIFQWESAIQVIYELSLVVSHVNWEISQWAVMIAVSCHATEAG